MSITVSFQGIEEKLRPWLNAQRIGMAAYGLMVVPHESRRPLVRALYDSWHQHFAVQEEQDNLQYRRKRLDQLPPSVLHILDTMIDNETPGNLPPYIESLNEEIPVKKALERLNERPSRKNGSPLGKAQIIAYHMLDSIASAHRIIALAMSLGENNCKSLLEDPQCLANIDTQLESLRKPNSDTLATLFAITQLGAILHGLSSWSQIENILLTQTFCWPLLVPEVEGYGLAMSLPVAVDLDFEGKFDGKGRAVAESMRSEKNNRGGVDTAAWQEHLDLAAEAAKELWFGKHKNHGIYERWREHPDDFRRKVLDVNVVFEFHWANCILGEDLRIPLNDGSADSYLAMAVLARLLGRRGSLSSVVTGVIGQRCTEEDEEGNLREEQDYWVIPPGGIPAKLRYLFAAQAFERVALPKGCEDDTEIQELISPKATKGKFTKNGMHNIQTAEVAYGAKLSHLADIVQTGGWRQYRYIRCPELQWAIHEKYHVNRPGLMGTADIRVRRTRDLLRNNSAPVLDLQNEQEVTPRAVASRLWHINRIERIERFRHQPSPPMFSTLFIRATHDQLDSRFWENIWRACGAPMADFERFHRAPTSAHAAAMLAEVLNHFQPQEQSAPGHRAPDIIVVIGAEHFTKSLESMGNPGVRIIAVAPVLDELIAQGQLRVAPIAHALTEFLGGTRIILMRDCPDDLDTYDSKAVLKELSKAERVALFALAAFRWGFNHSMASLMLHSPSLEDMRGVWGHMRTFLSGLCDKRVLRYGQGWYHIPPSLRDHLYQELSGMRKAEYHVAAGMALAPYTVDAAVPSLTFDRAFLPENLYEAYFHFDRADRLAKNEGKQGRGVQGIAFDRRMRLLRYAAFSTWSTIGALTRNTWISANRDAYTMAKELVELIEKEWAHSAHPAHYLNAAQSGVRCINGESRADIQTLLHEELAGAGGFYEKALKACEAPQFKKDRIFNRLLVQSQFANYLARRGSEHAARVEVLDQEIIQSIDASEDARGVQGEWFERLGNAQVAHKEAAYFYRLGVRWVPQWHQLWILAPGAAALAGEDINWIVTSLEHYAVARASVVNEPFSIEETVVFMLGHAGAGFDPSAPAWVQERWNAGVKVIENLWGHFQRVRRALQEINKY